MADAPLLTYQVWTSPSPVQSGVDFRLTVAVSAPQGPAVYCSQMKVSIPLTGNPSGGLASPDPAPGPQFTVNTGKWTVEATTVGPLSEDTGSNYATATFNCGATSDYEIDYPLVFEVSGLGDATPGILANAVLTQELSGSTSDPSTFTPKSWSTSLSKVPPQLYLDNFAAAVPTAPTVPATQFDNGAAILFEWESNADWFQLYSANNPTPIYQGSTTSFTLNQGPAVDTTFVLVGIASGNPSGTDVPAFLPIYLYDAITITVRNADLTPNTLSVYNATALNGATTVGTATAKAPLTVNGDETVNGNLTVGGTAAIGNVNVGGTLAVPGSTTLGNASLGGTLGVVGSSTLADASVNGTLQVGGNTTVSSLSASGSMSTATGLNSSGIVVISDVGDSNAIQAQNASSQYFCAGFMNPTPHSDYWITGVVSSVSGSGDCGFWTNGFMGTQATPGLFMDLPTRSGPRVVAHPVCVDAEIHVSGSGRTSGGQAKVELDPQVTDMLLHTDEHRYKVLLTPGGPCNGLAVTKRSQDRFVVRELGDGDSDVDFDWLIIARIPRELGADEATELPDRLPDLKGSVAPSPPALR